MAGQPLNTHPLADSSSASPSPEVVIPRALGFLRSHIQVSIPLYRRLQFGRFLPDSTLLTNLDLTAANSHKQDDRVSDAAAAPSGPWLIAFVDRSCRPETELWLNCSWEFGPAPRDDDPEALALLRRLLATLRRLPLPPSVHAIASVPDAVPLHDPGADSSGLSRADYASHASIKSIMLWGSIHERTTAYLQTLDVLHSSFASGLVPNHHFLFDVDQLSAGEAPALPAGFYWGEVQPRNFGLIRSRTQIPRQDRTMAVLPSLAIYPETEGGTGEQEPVAWAFVGLDGSLTTLHVEPACRGRGLAKAITVKLFRERMGRFREEGVKGWAHGIVIVGNEASANLCHSLGGELKFECYWLRVDLDRVER